MVSGDNPSAMSEWSDIVDGIIANITLLKDLGEKSVRLSPDTMSGFALPTAGGGTAMPASSATTEPVPSVAQKNAVPVAAPAVTVSGSVAPTVSNPSDAAGSLSELAVQIDACSACPLRVNRTKSVPGTGNPNFPDILFIGEAPGADEDLQGLPFVGRAGQFLTKMIEAMGYTRDQVFIANICKCRPPGNRTPMPEEMQTCLPFLKKQIEVIRPKTIVLLGATAARAILETQAGITRLRGEWTSYNGIPVMPTYHPSYVIRFDTMQDETKSRSVKLEVWRALKKVLAYLGKTPPPMQKS